MIAIALHHHRIERREREEAVRLLVLARGYHGAVDACLRNGWEEILALLLAGSTAAALTQGNAERRRVQSRLASR